MFFEIILCVFTLFLVTMLCGCERTEQKDKAVDVIAKDNGKNIQNTKKTAYLTFDDGPSCLTEKYLDILEREGVKATFFVIGQQINGEEQTIKREISQGHEIGVHTYCHEADRIYCNCDTYYLSPQVVIRENIEVEKPGQGIEVVHAAKEIKATQTTIPFFKSNNLDYADLVSFMGEHAQTAGWILFVFVTIFVVTAVSNGANLNDGMDGMAAGNSAIIGLTLGILAYVSSHIEYAGYLNIMYIPGSEELVIFICAFIGAMIGFLWYNAYPAQVFMGDTGSLTIGGIIAVYAIIIHKELLIPILCGIFLVENLSVILQRVYYKAGKRKGVKQRLFKRTPIHDHFRTGMNLIEPGCKVVFTQPTQLFHESKITVRFWIVTIVLAAITIITLKIR